MNKMKKKIILIKCMRAITCFIFCVYYIRNIIFEFEPIFNKGVRLLFLCFVIILLISFNKQLNKLNAKNLDLLRMFEYHGKDASEDQEMTKEELQLYKETICYALEGIKPSTYVNSFYTILCILAMIGILYYSKSDFLMGIIVVGFGIVFIIIIWLYFIHESKAYNITYSSIMGLLEEYEKENPKG